MAKTKPIKESEELYNGHRVKVKTYALKKHRRDNYVANNRYNSCPNCLSRMTLNELGMWECSGDRLRTWESEFVKYRNMDKAKKLKYITSLSNSSRFLELYDSWEYALNSNGKEAFGCGYTNVLFPLNGSVQVRIPDPIFTKIIEQKIGRKLTEEELYEEQEISFYAGRVLTKYREGAKVIRIPWVVLPTEDTIYLPKTKPDEDE